MHTLVFAENVVLANLLERILLGFEHRVFVVTEPPSASVESPRISPKAEASIALPPIVLPWNGGFEALDAIIVSSSSPAATVRALRGRAGSGPVLCAVLNSAHDAEAVLSAGADDYFLPEDDITTRLRVVDTRARALREARSKGQSDRHLATAAVAASEARTRAAEETFRALVERMPDPVLLHRDGVVLWANAACVAALGYEGVEALTGQNVLGFVAEEDRPTALAAMKELKRTGQPSPPIELRVLRKDGGRVLFELAPISLVDVEGSPASLVVARDVTQRREMHERLLTAERLAAMGSLAACIAHEINNPLTYVIGNLSYLARSLGEHLEESSRSLRLEMALADAREGVERVRRIVSDLTALAQPEAEARAVTDLRRILESTFNVASNEIKHRARLERAFGDVPHVRANEVQLGQLFLDLLLSAGRPISEGAASEHTISVSAGHDLDGFAVVEVRRSSRARLERIPGFGPTLAQTITASLGGEFTSSGDLTGSVSWRIRLPPAAAEAPKPAPPRAPSRESPESARVVERARILVVDDEPVIASTMRRALENHDIYVVTSGRDALELCRGESFDLVLCDLMMPDLTGMDLYEQLRLDDHGREKCIIFMTGGAFTQRAKSFLAQVPNICVEKPFDVDQIQALVDSYFGKTRVPPAAVT